MADPIIRDGRVWCPACVRHVPVGEMRVLEGREFIWLETCKRCQSSRRISNRRAVVAANRP